MDRMRLPDLEKERSEKMLSMEEFITEYNSDLPESFPRVTELLLHEFKDTYPSFFKDQIYWTLGQHRKRVMDWLPHRVASQQN